VNGGYLDMIDMTGKVCGRWTVIKRAKNGSGRRARWLCECECGNKKELDGYNLRNGLTTKCDECRRKENPRRKDYTGQEFGRLIALEPAGATKHGLTKWRCSCSCGNEAIVTSANLKNNHTQSCGCLSRELTKQGRNRLSLEGMIFGYIEVIDRHDTRSWRCKCHNCGDESIVVKTNSLVSGDTRSCGCARIKDVRHLCANRYLSSLRGEAKRHENDMCLSIEDVRSLIFEPCTYCGSGPSNTIKLKPLKKFIRESDYVRYNGLDRKDNSKGYVISNVVTCCKRCNTAKNDMAIEEWLDHIDKINTDEIRRKLGIKTKKKAS